MLCDKCINRNICKYYSFFVDAPMQITIESCEKYKCNEKQNVIKYQNPNDNMALLKYKEPIDYSKLNLQQFEEETSQDDEEEERIVVDLSEQHVDKITSITDLLLGDDK